MNLKSAVRDLMNDIWRERQFYATVTGSAGSTVTISSARVNGTFIKNAAYTPVNGDVVKVEWVDDGYIVAYKVG